MMNPNVLLHEQAKIVSALAPVAPSSSAPAYISMKGYPVLTIIITALNGTTVTGSAIALSQATAVAGTGAKTLAFSQMYSNVDTAATDNLAVTTVTSNTFTTNTTNSKALMYEITVHETDLDMANNFDCVAVTTGNAVNTTVSVLYILWPAKYGKTQPPSAILD